MLSEFYNQNPLRRFAKNMETGREEREAEAVRMSIAQARLVDDAEIARRLGARRRKEPIPKFGNLARTDTEDADKSEEQVAFERGDAAAERRYAAQVAEAEADLRAKAARQSAAQQRAEYVGSGQGVPLAEAIRFEDQSGNVPEELDLDRPGRDAAFFNIREPRAHVPVGKDRLRELLRQGYASAKSRAFAAEKTATYETGIVREEDLGLDDDEGGEELKAGARDRKDGYADRWVASQDKGGHAAQSGDQSHSRREHRSQQLPMRRG